MACLRELSNSIVALALALALYAASLRVSGSLDNLSLRGGFARFAWATRARVREFFREKGAPTLYNHYKKMDGAKTAIDAAGHLYDVYKKGMKSQDAGNLSLPEGKLWQKINQKRAPWSNEGLFLPEGKSWHKTNQNGAQLSKINQMLKENPLGIKPPPRRSNSEDTQEPEATAVENVQNELEELYNETDELFERVGGMEKYYEAMKEFKAARTQLESMAMSVARIQERLDMISRKQSNDSNAASEKSASGDSNKNLKVLKVLKSRRVPACPFGIHTSVADCFSDRCLVSCARCRETLIKPSKENSGGPQVCLRCRRDMAAGSGKSSSKKRKAADEEDSDEVKIISPPVKKVKSSHAVKKVKSPSQNKNKTKAKTKIQNNESKKATDESDGSQIMTIWEIKKKRAAHKIMNPATDASTLTIKDTNDDNNNGGTSLPTP
ncbi:hypothetical protein F5X99DRAFT_428044 [Biscogniauxia marginata]|nr:hypothetical protein F5X99DRAFT_428044 [Biscogniauxia marginata]